MKKNILAAAIAVVAGSSQAELIITGIIDGPVSSKPKAIELYATTDIADLSDYSLKLYSNGNTSVTSTYSFASDSIQAGTYITVSTDSEGFLNYFGTRPTYGDSNLQFNGDDAIALHNAETDAVLDTFGVIGVDGSGEDWEYLDGWAYRNSAYANSSDSKAANAGSFNAANWTFSGANAIDNEVSNAFADSTMPVMGIESSLTAPSIGQCGDSATLISAIQADSTAGSYSPLVSNIVVTEAVVYQVAENLSGYFIQEEDSDSDNSELTSEGVFVYDSANEVTVGDKIRTLAAVAEYQGVTELKPQSFIACETGVALPSAASLSLPVDSIDKFEQLEGMRVSIPDNLVVSDFYGNYYGFGQDGQFLVSHKLHFQPTEIAEPSVESYNAAVEAKKLGSILIDDGSSSTKPASIPFPNSEGFSNTNYFRIGFGVSGIAGAMHNSVDEFDPFYQYMIVPSAAPIFDPLQSDRTLEPEVDASANLKVASMNVLNLFNGVTSNGTTLFPDDDGFSSSDYRGADNAADYEIQLAKIVAALEAMDADVIGLMEIENDGFDENSSIYALTEALNKTQAEGSQYEFVNPGASKIGDDAIAVGLLYRPSVVTLSGTTVILDSDNSPLDDDNKPLFIDDKNRPSLIQSFEHVATGDQFTVSVNHLKSKGSSCSSLGDPNLNDGQGNCNVTRTNAVKALTQFMATNPTGVETDNVIFMGDMNAYSKEDPIVAFEDAGYSNLKYTDKSTEEQPYSYSFSGFLGSLDQVMGSDSMASRLVSIDDWHINSVESDLFDYDKSNDNKGNDSYASEDQYFSSDHDPVIAGFIMVKESDDSDDSSKDDDDNGGALGFIMLPMLLGLLRLRRKS